MGASSDHYSFLARGIPAIDFTSDVTFPIHTPLDSWANFTPSGLPRSGDLVLKLFERFDGGVPSRTTEKYLLIVAGHTPLYFSPGLLRGVAVIAILAGIAVLFLSRKRRPLPAGIPPVRWSGVKLVFFTFIVESFIWLSENVIGVIRGYRFPWVNNYGGFVVLAIFCGLIGLWLSLGMARRLRLTRDPFPYYVRAFILLALLTVLLSLANAELAAYPAFSLMFLSLAMFLRPPVLKGAFLVLTPYPVARLVFQEYTGLYQRILADLRLPSFSSSVIYNALFILFFSMLALPFVFAFAAVYRDSSADLFWLRRFGGTAGIALAAGGTLMSAVLLLFRPVYGPLWERSVSVTQTYRLGADSGAVNIASAEYLSGIRCTVDGIDSTFDGRRTSMPLHTERPAVVTWLSVDRSLTRRPERTGAGSVMDRRLVIHSAFRPLSVVVSYRSDRPFAAVSPWVRGVRHAATPDTGKNKIYTWYAFPDTPLVVPVTVTLRDSQSVRETVEVTYDSLEYPLTVDRDMTYFIKRTIVDAGAAFRADEGRVQ